MRVRNSWKYSAVGLKPEILDAQYSVFEELRRAGVATVYRTAGTNGSHSRNSLHYVGLAMDFWWQGVRDGKVICDAIAESLGDEYDVVWERSHLHIEFQPEKGLNYVADNDS